LALSANIINTRLLRPVRDIHSSLLRTKLYNIGTQCQFHQHFMRITYSHNRISHCISKTKHGIMEAQSLPPRVVSYEYKMLMKSTTVCKLIPVIKILNYCLKVTKSMQNKLYKIGLTRFPNLHLFRFSGLFFCSTTPEKNATNFRLNPQIQNSESEATLLRSASK
jgi:hypothetical protein